MKSRFACITLLLLAAGLAVPAASNAQGLKIGPQLGINLDGSDVFIGLESQFNLPVMESREVWGNIGFDYYPFIDHVKASSVNVDVLFPFNVGSMEFYGGGGLLMKFVSIDVPEGFPGDGSDSDVGIDLKAGLLFGSPESGYRPFIEINQTLGAGSDFLARGGVFVAIGGR